MPTTLGAVATDLFAPAGSWPSDDAFDRLWPGAEPIEGWLSPGQARVLMRAAPEALASRRFRYLGAERTLVAFARHDLGAGAAVASAAAMAGRYPYFVRNLAVKLLLRRGRPGLARRALRYREGDDLF